LRTFLFLFLGSLFSLCLRAQEKFASANIPAKLLLKADVVKRSEDLSIQVISTEKVVVRHTYALTILNENGDEAATMLEFYDQLKKIRSISGTLYDAGGKVLQRLKEREINDQSAVQQNNLFDDKRCKVHRFFHREYPYTIEYSIQMEFNHSLFFPVWLPQEAERLAVEQSACTVEIPAGNPIRYRASHYPAEPEKSQKGSSTMLRWEVKELQALRSGAASPPLHERSPSVILAPNAFYIQGYKGSMESWKEFGRFQTALNQQRDQLPAELIQTIQQLTAGINDPAEKIRLLYDYLKKNTRYISIQLGLGGWQPFEANFVAEKGYGDCKGLTNYMRSLLKAAGINSYYAIVKAGDQAKDDVLPDFPYLCFNHAILCAIAGKDTVWLDCTSQSMPAGYLGSFCGNRQALLATEEGGVLVSTPRYGLTDNTLVRKLNGQVHPEGHLSFQSETRYRGMQQDRLSMMMQSLSTEEKRNYLQHSLPLSTFVVNQFNYRMEEDKLPAVVETLDVQVNGYATLSGKRIFLQPNVLHREAAPAAPEQERSAEVVLHFSWRDEDHYELSIPEGYTLESAPPPIDIKTAFGSFSSKVSLQGGKLFFQRIREQFAGRHPASEALAYLAFCEAIHAADQQKIVLVKLAN